MSKRKVILSLFLLLSLLLISGTTTYATKKTKLSITKKTVNVGDTATIKLLNNSKAVKWQTSNKNIKITKKSKKQAKIKALKKGTSYLKAKVGTKTYKCKITIKEKKTPKVDSEVVFEKDGISIQTENITESDKAYTLNFVAKNNGEKDCSVVAHSYCVNGLFCGDNKYGFRTQDVPVGKKARYSLSIGKDWMKDNRITDIASFQIIFWVYIDSYASIQSGVVEIKTNLYDAVTGYEPKGTNVYADNDIILWYVGNNKNEYTFIMKNNTTETSYTIDNFSVNEWGYKLTEYTYNLYDEEMLPNTYVKFTIPIEQSFLTSNGIKKVETLEFNIKYSYLRQSDKITIKIQ